MTRSGVKVTVSYSFADNPLDTNQTVAVVLTFQDSNGENYSETWSFTAGPNLDSILPPGTRYIEANDYDYENGQWIVGANGGPTGVPYAGGAYANHVAVQGVDASESETGDGGATYRLLDVDPTLIIGDDEFNNGSNGVRGGFTLTTNWKIGWTVEADWQNYTRDFVAESTEYTVIASHSRGDGETIGSVLSKVTEGSGTAAQTLEELGVFSGVGSGDWGTAILYTMVDRTELDKPIAERVPKVITLSGENTLRWTQGIPDRDGDVTADHNFLAFVPNTPVPSGPITGVSIDGNLLTITYDSSRGPLVGSHTVNGTYEEVDNDGTFTVDVTSMPHHFYTVQE